MECNTNCDHSGLIQTFAASEKRSNTAASLLVLIEGTVSKYM